MCGDGAKWVALFRVGFFGTLFWTKDDVRGARGREAWCVAYYNEIEYMFARKFY